MHLQTFTAATMSEALAQVKSVLGTAAVILHTRTYQRRYCLGLRRKEIVEITAGTGLQVPARRGVQDRATRQPGARPDYAGPSLGEMQFRRPAASFQPQAQRYQGLAQAEQAPGRALLDSPVASNIIIRDLTDQMSTLKTMVQGLVTEVRHSRSPSVPEEVFDQYLRLTNNQVCDELAGEIVKQLHQSVRTDVLQQPAMLQAKLAEQIEKMIPTAGPIVRKKVAGPHVVALIGPTGVGKTTTIAKLAANLKLREKRKVGLITIDTYRIAAIDQLKKYADIIGSPLRVVGSAEDLRSAVQAMTDCEFVLIDTAGRSPNDTLKLNELKSFLAAASPDEVHLVLATTASQASAELAIDRFGDVRADKLIFTKLDEAANVGIVLNVIRKVGRPLSYVTTGQDVPDDIEEAKGKRLAQLILGSGL